MRKRDILGAEVKMAHRASAKHSFTAEDERPEVGAQVVTAFQSLASVDALPKRKEAAGVINLVLDVKDTKLVQVG